MRPLALAAAVLVLPLLLTGTAAPEEATTRSGLWTFDPGAESVTLSALFEKVHSVTGETIVYNASDPAIRGKRIDLAGAVTVPEARVFDWLRSILSYQKLVLVPLGPREAHQWAVLNVTDPTVASHPIQVPASELEKWADRDGAFIMTVLTLEQGVDTNRARTALANLVTRPNGRLQSVPGSRSIVVEDFAPVVASIARMAAQLEVETAPPARITPAPRAAPAPDLRHYEQMLCGSRTDAAASYFLRKIAALEAERAKKGE